MEDDNNKIDDEDLEKASGGFGGRGRGVDSNGITQNAYSSVGIKWVPKTLGFDEYIYNGRKLTQKEAQRVYDAEIRRGGGGRGGRGGRGDRFY